MNNRDEQLIFTGHWDLDGSDSDNDLDHLDSYLTKNSFQKIEDALGATIKKTLHAHPQSFNKLLYQAAASESPTIETPGGDMRIAGTSAYSSKCVSRVTTSTSPIAISSVFKPVLEQQDQPKNDSNEHDSVGLEL